MRFEWTLLAAISWKTALCRRHNAQAVLAMTRVNVSHESHIAFDRKASHAVQSLSNISSDENISSDDVTTSESALLETQESSVFSLTGTSDHAFQSLPSSNSSAFVDVSTESEGNNFVKRLHALIEVPDGSIAFTSMSILYGVLAGVVLGWCCCCCFLMMQQKAWGDDADEDYGSMFSLTSSGKDGKDEKDEDSAPEANEDKKKEWGTGKRLKKGASSFLRKTRHQ